MTSAHGGLGFKFNFVEVPPGIQAASQQGTVILNAQDNVTGQESTVSQGSTTLLQAVAPTGQSATSQRGNVTLNLADQVSGLQGDTSQGSVSVNIQVNVTGLSSTAERGTISVTFPGYGLNPWGQGTWGQ